MPASSMEEIDVYEKMSRIEEEPQFEISLEGEEPEHLQRLLRHISWMSSIRHERPSPEKPFKVAVYIRYFNQTKYENYLAFHKKQFSDTISLCPNWEFVGFYIDVGSTAPNMESAPEWSRLLNDCMEGKVNLIITQKVSNVSRKPYEVTLCARILATQSPPIGMYFVSEDIYTLATYYQGDLKDTAMLPAPDWNVFPEIEEGAQPND